jgi:hypothetical protein
MPAINFIMQHMNFIFSFNFSCALVVEIKSKIRAKETQEVRWWCEMVINMKSLELFHGALVAAELDILVFTLVSQDTYRGSEPT